MATDNKQQMSFWDAALPGMFAGAGSFFGQKDAEKSAQNKLNTATSDPLYQQQANLAGQSFNLAGNMDPAAIAKQRFQAQQGLVAPSDEAARLKMQRELLAKGQFGVGSWAPTANGVQPTAATGAINPQMASLLAAQEAAKNRAAYDSMQEGEQYLDNILRRGGMLSQGAQNTRSANLAVQPPKAPGIGSQLLQGIGGSLMKNPGILFGGDKGMFGGLFGDGGLGGALSGVGDWFGGLFKSGPSASDLWGGGNWV